MRYVFFLTLTIIVIIATAPAYPHSRDPQEGEVGIEILSENGSPFLIIPHRDFWKEGAHVLKQYLEARKGENYGIVIRNMTPERIGVVIAVDGRNIISGKKSNLRDNEPMYIVNSYESGQYNGWRTASNAVHKFYFTDTADSYAMRTFSDSSSMGVIAVAIYREKERVKPLYEGKRMGKTSAESANDSAARIKKGTSMDESAGTGFGDELYSPVINVAFEPEPRPVQKMLVRYEWREVLCRKGIMNCGKEPGTRLWDEDEYAPHPPGYPWR
jgi:hypothetical protein